MPSTRHAILRFFVGGLFVFVLLLAVGAGILWTRLANGPIPLTFLKAAISQTMGAALPGFTTRFDAVTLALDDGSLELQLTNVRVRDVARGELVAVSPTAAISLSTAALLNGQFAAEHIDLVRPAMRLFYSREDGIALSFTRPIASSEVPVPAPAGRSVPLPPQEASAAVAVSGGPGSSIFEPPPAGTGIIDLSRTIHRLVVGQVVADATRYLKSLGVRGATLLIDDPEEPARLAVRRVLLSLEPLARGSRVTGLVDIAEAEGGLLEFVAEPMDATRGAAAGAGADSAADRTAPIALRIDVNALNPAILSDKVAPLRAFRALNAPMRMTSRLAIAATGDVVAGSLDVSAERGTIEVDQAGTRVRVPLDTATFDVRYNRAQSRFDIGPSTLGWDGHRLTFIGAIARDTTSSTGEFWDLSLTGTDGFLRRVASAEPGRGTGQHEIERFSAEGRIVVADDAAIQLEKAELGVGGGVLTMSAATGRGVHAVSQVVGTVTDMPRDVVLAAWPETILDPARAILRDKIIGGKIRSGRFALNEADLRETIRGHGTEPDRRQAPALIALDARDVRLRVKQDAPVLVAPALDFTFAIDGHLSATAANVAVEGVAPEKLQFRGARYVLDPAQAAPDGAKTATLTAEFNGELQPVAELLDAAKASWSAGEAEPGDQKLPRPTFTNGRITGQIRVVFPADAAAGEPPIITGNARVTEGAVSAKDLPFPISQGAIDLKLSRNALVASGTVQVGAVPAEVSFQHVLDRDTDDGTPLRLSATLDRAERRQFGFDLGGVISGPTPVNVTLPRFPRAPGASVVVDLSAARLMFASLGFHKEPGARAQLEFNVVPKPDRTVALEDLRLTGTTTAIQGHALIGRSGHLERFEFPSFSLDLVSRVQLSGSRREASSGPPIWDVTANGPVIDGKGIFRGLSALAEATAPVDANEPGLDLQGSFDTVLGFGQTSLRGVKVRLSKRGGRLTSLSGQGRLSDQGRVEAAIETIGERRRLVARTNNAGSMLRLVDFYENMRRGDMRLQLDLDGGSRDIRRGSVSITDFEIFGDPIVSEVVLAGGTGQRPAIARGVRPTRVLRETLPFTNMVAEFEVGHDQFVIRDAQATGPMIGGSLRGKADYGRDTIHIGGTYSFLQPLNRLPAILPGIGQILTGPRQEGVLALNFAVRGPMSQPQVIVNPLSAVMPGIFREIFTMSPATSRVVPRSEAGAQGNRPGKTGRGGSPGLQTPTRIIGDWAPTTRPAWTIDPFEAR